MKKLKKGFTLIELLVVIAIIALLAAILFPVFARARENARRASCQSNLKQISLGVLQYVQDYDERFPLAFYNARAGSQYGWSYFIQPYAKSIQVLQCPSEPMKQTEDPNSYNYNDYALNRCLSSHLHGMNSARLENSANTLLVFEGYYNHTTAQVAGAAIPYGDYWGAVYASDAATGVRKDLYTGLLRHLEGSNFSFTDGHVKWLKPNVIPNVGQFANPPAPTSSNVTFSPYSGCVQEPTS